jgi:hypothetical protein
MRGGDDVGPPRASARRKLADRRVEESVQHEAVLHRRRTEPAFEQVARLLEHPAGPGIPLEHVGIDAAEIEGLEGMVGEPAHRGRREAAPPERLAEPVTDLGRIALDVRLEEEAHAAHGLAGHLDRELGLRRRGRHPRDPRLRVGQGIRVREAVAHVEPNLAVVRMPGERGLVAHAPASDATIGKIELHHERYGRKIRSNARNSVFENGKNTNGAITISAAPP